MGVNRVPVLFIKTMIEEKGLSHDIVRVDHEGTAYQFTVNEIIEFIENSPGHIQEEIKSTFSKIDFNNGDLSHYLKFLALCIVKSQYDEEDETIITCSECGKNFDEADVNIIDYDLDLCISCEKKHLAKQNIV